MNPWLVLSALVALAALVVVPIGIATFLEWRRPWRLVCPRAGMVAQIRVGAAHAAVAEVLGGQPAVAGCSLWPPMADCRDECLAMPRQARRAMRRGEPPPRARADGASRPIVVPLASGVDGELPPVKEIRDADDRVVADVDRETDRLAHEARQELGRAAALLEGLAVEHAVQFGDATTAIVEESEEAGADLIALPVHRRGRHGRRSDTRIPLLVVPPAEAAG